LGRIADNDLRSLKHQSHQVFDPLWKNKTFFKHQKQAYAWLSKKMNTPIEYTHFGMFTMAQCQEAISHIEELKQSQKIK
jgi:hypothetical protein